ncbi:MAG: LysM peptidoglycan-binding domain-containing protein [Candidatus Saccharimonadales bacterium]
MRSKRLQLLTTFTTYATMVALIASVVSVGYQSPIEQQLSSERSNGSTPMQLDNPSVDQLQAAELAADAAQIGNLSVTSNATNLSISLAAKSELSQTSDSVLSKPQIVQTGTDVRGISEYTTVAADNAQTVAAKYGISTQTLKWANGLVNDAINPGTKLQIPGTNGVIYTVKPGDDLAAIAAKYGTQKERIMTYNDLEVSGISPGQRIVLPDGVLPGGERPENQVRAPVRSSGSTTVAYSPNAAVVGNRYDYGYCTWYAYNRRAELGRPVGSFWGNAATWASFARASGYLVNNTPEVGAVMQDSYSAGGYGHVAVVESKGDDGSITISEMNYAGWNVKSFRTLDAGQAARYNYIH